MTSHNDEKRISSHVIFCMFLIGIGWVLDSPIPIAIAAWLLIMALLSLLDDGSKAPKDPPAIPPTGKTSTQGA